MTVSVSEAHPTEGGDYMDYFHPVSQHRSIQDRIQAAGGRNTKPLIKDILYYPYEKRRDGRGLPRVGNPTGDEENCGLLSIN